MPYETPGTRDMPPDESNEYFDHLNRQPARRPSSTNNERPEDFSRISDPFAEEETSEHKQAPPASQHTFQGRGRERQSQRVNKAQGPGLSPGIPNQRSRKPTDQVKRSGVVLTPSGVQRRSDEPKTGPKSATRRVVSAPVEDEDASFHESSRDRNEEGDVGWEEYAASDFPAMEAGEFGVKVKTTNSGRVVPVGVRADLTDEAIKNQSVKGGGRRPRPTQSDDGDSEAPRSFMQKIGDTLRITRPDLDDEPAAEAKSSGGGFARSGSMSDKGGGAHSKKKSPLGMAWGVFVEVVKIFLLVLLLRAYVVQVSQVQGPSMEPTLVEGDRLIVERVTPVLVNNSEKVWLKWAPDFAMPEFERGDIVVVRSPEDPGQELVKRLIGLPGDTIKFETGNLYVKPKDGEFEVIKESYLENDELKREDGTYRAYEDASDLGGIVEGEELVVPPDRIFVLGDNRSHSNDSRRWLEIAVNRTEPEGIDNLWLHKSSIEGRVIFRIYPFDRTWPPVK